MARSKGYRRARLLRGREAKSGRPVAPDGLNRENPGGLAVLADAHLTALRVKNQSPRTVETRQHSLKLFLQWAEERGLLVPGEITRPILESYQRHLWNHRKPDGKPLGVGTQTNRLTAIRGFFKWLYREGRIDADPAAHLEMPKMPHRLPDDTLSEEEVAALLNVPDTGDPLGVRDRAMLELFYSTGLRRAELARLELRDLERERRLLFVRQGKGAKDRVVPVGARAMAWVERYLEEVRPLLCLDAGQSALFLTGYGRGFSYHALGDLVTRLVNRALGPRGSCHLLRHACATHMLEHGADIRVIQQLLGHANLSTTQVYTEVSIKLLREVHARTHPSA